MYYCNANATILTSEERLLMPTAVAWIYFQYTQLFFSISFRPQYTRCVLLQLRQVLLRRRLNC